MDYTRFNSMVVEHRNAIIQIGIILIIIGVLGVLIVEFYVRKELECEFFEIKDFRFSPTLLMIIPLIVAVIVFSVKCYQCNYDIKNVAYEEYIGEIEYSYSSVRLLDSDCSIFVGKGHEIVPAGKHYGKVIFSTKAKVIVWYEEKDRNE